LLAAVMTLGSGDIFAATVAKIAQAAGSNGSGQNDFVIRRSAKSL
jgi:hypothetical protein